MIYGLDLLGAAKYPEIVQREFPEGWALGVFDNTFGNAYRVVQTLVDTGRCPHVRIQMLWSDTHQFGDGDIKKLKKIARPYELLARRSPQIRFELSPFCEHNLRNPDKYLDIVKTEAPSCQPVNVPWKGALSQKYKNEVHKTSHMKVPGVPYNFSYDGANCVDANIEKDKAIVSSCDVFFLWHCRFNLKWSMKDTTPRPQRKAKPDEKLIDSVIYLHRAKGETKLPKGWLLKSHAEHHGLRDNKGDKLLIISPHKANSIELKTRNGQTVAQLVYNGSYSGGGYRYYSKGWGYEAALKAIRIQGDPLTDVYIGRRKFGVVNPGFRDGYYR
jgi:hypothetical protein